MGMNFDFDFTFIKNGTPIVTLNSLGISFNRGAVDMIGAPQYVQVGYDAANHAIGVRPSDGIDSENAHAYLFAPRVRNNWVRIGAKDFMSYLYSVTKIDFISQARQFTPEYDEDTNTLIIIVDDDHLK